MPVIVTSIPVGAFIYKISGLPSRSGASVRVATSVMTQSFDQFKLKLTLQYFRDSLMFFQTLLKYFNETTISTCLVLKLSDALPVIFASNLNK